MTTIQISKKTQQRLIQIISDYQKKLGRRINYDEIIQIILNDFKAKNKAIEDFQNDFGILQGKSDVIWSDLRALKSEVDEKEQILSFYSRYFFTGAIF